MSYLRIRPQDASVRVLLLAFADVGLIRREGAEFLLEMKATKAERLAKILRTCGYAADNEEQP